MPMIFVPLILQYLLRSSMMLDDHPFITLISTLFCFESALVTHLGSAAFFLKASVFVFVRPSFYFLMA